MVFDLSHTAETSHQPMPLQSIRYNEIRQKSAHNAFERREGLYDQVVYWRIRSLEIDIHTGKERRPKVNGDWYVYHLSVVDHDTTVDRLSGFLRICCGIGRAIPRHEVVTVFLDAKDAFHTTLSASHSALALDRLLVEHLGKDRIFTPGDLLARSPKSTSLQDAVGQCGWPSLKELRGKILFVLTGDAEKLKSYADQNSAANRMAFLSARVSNPNEVPSDNHIVFYNLKAKHLEVAKTIHEKGFVSRAYYVDSQAQWDSARLCLCHHIATDKVNERVDSWSRTRQPGGYPFELLSGPTPPTTEYGRVCGLAARSGDLWGVKDSFYFHFHDYDKAPENTYELLVAGPNSHVDDWTKGGLVARASLGAGSPYFGVFRVGEHHGLRVQYRLASGARTTAAEDRCFDPKGMFDTDTLAFLKLRLLRGGRRARAWGSVDGRAWVEIETCDFDQPLRYQGIGVSAHDQHRGAKFLFLVPARRPRPALDQEMLIGGRDGDFGWWDWVKTQRWKVDDFGGPA